jgi:hypothetical protein
MKGLYISDNQSKTSKLKKWLEWPKGCHSQMTPPLNTPLAYTDYFSEKRWGHSTVTG